MTDPHQPSLWADSLEDALRDAVIAAGGPKKVGSALWPAKPVPDAARLLNHCLDPDRPEKLAQAEILMIMRIGVEVGCHTPMHFLAAALGYEPPRKIEPEDELARLQREFLAAVKAQEQLVRRMEQLAGMEGAGKS